MDYPGKVITKTQVTPTQTSASGNWTLDDQAAAIKNNNWPVALVPNPISKSLRFNSADTAYLNRTPASAGNRKTWTWSGWIKRSGLGIQVIFGVGNVNTGSTFGGLYFDTDDTLVFYSPTSGGYKDTTQVFRDVGAWYHIVCGYDTPNSIVKLYVNGTEITAFSTNTNPSANVDGNVNAAVSHTIGKNASTSEYYLNGYMTEVNFVDGQALTPSDFGLTNPQTGQWIPKKYTGTYGTNGFYLNFKDATSTTTLGYDYSGNANNWTTNNFSVTAGVGNDSLTDVPTPWFAYNTTGDVGGVIRGNYATLNPLRPLQSGDSLSDGNLTITTGTTATGVYPATIGISSGKWYWEVLMVTQPAANTGGVGVAKQGITASFTTGSVLYENSTGNKYIDGTASAYGATWQTNDIIACAYNADTGTFEFFKNGSSQGSFTASGYAGVLVFPVMADGTGQSLTHTYNFGQRPFAYTPPAGFRSLCTTNLPATTIGFGLTNQADDYFNTVLYTGNGTTNAITGVGFQPDFVWLKSRSGATTNHALFDAVRGVGYNLRSNTTEAEAIPSPNDSLTAFNSDGFTLGANANSGAPNINFTVGGTYVGWNWKAGGTGVTNTAGSITSTVSANTTAGFSIVTYTGTGSNATVGHGLGVAPSMVIVKSRTGGTSSWAVWFTGFSGTEYILLESTAAKASAASVWNSTVPNSTVVSIGTGSVPNTNGWTYVMYCFAAVAGYSAFGSYTGNGSADGPFVYLGFRPRYVMVKRTDSTAGWAIFDAARSTFNVVNDWLYANASDAEYVDTGTPFDFTSNGFKVRVDGTYVAINANTGTYIYAAFAESPFQFANAR
jgi:hypothetical protein